ncbi:hypothetical protein [Nonomuraea sediminis]|uniref:hypothetical protein n=1 Tax=Nonomuraea sediminis TaxID=2835864 RepID=UPI001BDBC660|nr:hypothetical protein [Nonomuraea sediminis]
MSRTEKSKSPLITGAVLVTAGALISLRGAAMLGMHATKRPREVARHQWAKIRAGAAAWRTTER